MEKIKKYLPSKKFFAVLLVFVIIFSLFITIKQTILLFKDKIATNKNKKGPTELVVGSLIQKDSNSNGIADWEEYLWGLNPAKNGQKNKEFIESKKKALTESGDIKAIDESQAISDSEMLSREFFATIVSLQQTGTLDDESL